MTDEETAEELAALRDDNTRLREDVVWLFALIRGFAGEPKLAEGETAHDWSTGQQYETRYVNDWGSLDEHGIPNTSKFRRVWCPTCGQFWTHF